MADTVLEKVKSIIGVTGSYMDDTVQGYIDEVKQYLLDGGAQQNVVDAPTSIGTIARGVSDLLYDKALSNHFKERAVQLALKRIDDNVQANN